MIEGHDGKALFELPQSTICSFHFENLEKWLLNLQWFDSLDHKNVLAVNFLNLQSIDSGFFVLICTISVWISFKGTSINDVPILGR